MTTAIPVTRETASTNDDAIESKTDSKVTATTATEKPKAVQVAGDDSGPLTTIRAQGEKAGAVR